MLRLLLPSPRALPRTELPVLLLLLLLLLLPSLPRTELLLLLLLLLPCTDLLLRLYLAGRVRSLDLDEHSLSAWTMQA